MSDEVQETPSLEERVRVIEDRLADLDAFMAQVLEGQAPDDPMLAAFLRHRKAGGQ